MSNPSSPRKIPAPLPAESEGLREYLSSAPGQAHAVFKGPLSRSSRYVFDRAFAQLSSSFPTLVVIDATKLSNPSDKKGLNAFLNFVLSVRQKGNKLRFVGLCQELAAPLLMLGLAHKEEFGAAGANEATVTPPAEPRPQPTGLTAKTRTRTKSRSRKGTRTLQLARGAGETSTGIVLQAPTSTSLEFDRVDSPLRAPVTAAPGEPVDCAKGSLRAKLEALPSPARVDLWKRLDESLQLSALVRQPTEEEAEMCYFSKDRTHALLLERLPPDARLAPKHLQLFALQLSRMVIDLEFPVASVSVVFLVDAEAPGKGSLVSVFDEQFQLPVIRIARGSLSSSQVKGRGTRQGRNAVRYPVELVYKTRKIELRITVKVVELPAAWFRE